MQNTNKFYTESLYQLTLRRSVASSTFKSAKSFAPIVSVCCLDKPGMSAQFDEGRAVPCNPVQRRDKIQSLRYANKS